MESILACRSHLVVTAHQKLPWVAYTSQESAQLPQPRSAQSTMDVPPQPWSQASSAPSSYPMVPFTQELGSPTSPTLSLAAPSCSFVPPLETVRCSPAWDHTAGESCTLAAPRLVPTRPSQRTGGWDLLLSVPTGSENGPKASSHGGLGDRASRAPGRPG